MEGVIANGSSLQIGLNQWSVHTHFKNTEERVHPHVKYSVQLFDE